MDEQISGAAPVESAPLPVLYKDRSVGMIIFGILTILLGCVAGLCVLAMLAGQTAVAKKTGAAAPASSMLSIVFLYGGLAVALVWLGIGSCMVRRWARALLLIFSWSWLIMGLFMVVAFGVILPKILANLPTGGTNGQPPLPTGIIMVVAMLFLGFCFIILPVVWVLFYQSRHVKATCEARDPVPGWTDACPLPVLGFCLWTAFSVPMMLVMPLSGHAVLPFFGMFLGGFLAMMLYLVIAAIWGYAAWSLYKLEQRGWWVILIAMCVFTVSALLTYAQHDFTEMSRLMGTPEAQIEQMQKTGILSGHWMTWVTGLCMVPFLGYLLFIKKYFRKS